MRNNIGFSRPAAPALSVIITTYNYASFVGTAIASALAQNYTPLEVLVMDNASTDDTPEVTARFAVDPRVRVIRHAENIGMTRNHNAGIEAATGDYVVFLSADDFFLPGHLHGIVDFHRAHPNLDVVFGGYYHANIAGRILKCVRHLGLTDGSYACGRNEFADLLTYDCYTCMPTTLFARDLLLEIGGFDGGLGAGDYDLYLTLAARGHTLGYHDVASTVVRIHAGAGTSEESYVKTGNQLRDHLYILEKHLTSKNEHRIRSRELGVRRLLGAKIANVNGYPKTANRLAAEFAPRIAALHSRLTAVEQRNLGAQRRSGPAVSVLMVVGERVALLTDALDSLQMQDFADWEAVIVSDGGPDLTHLLAQHPVAGRLRYLRHNSVRGFAVARNTAARLAGGEIITYLSDDSRFEPLFLSTAANALRERDHLWVRASTRLVIESLDPVGQTLRNEELRLPTFTTDPDDTLAPWVAPGIALDAVAHRRSCFDRLGTFNEHLRILDDYEFLLRLGQQAPPLSLDSTGVELRWRVGADEQRAYRERSDYLGYLRALYDAYPGPGGAQLAGRRHAHIERLTAALTVEQGTLATASGVAALAAALAGIPQPILATLLSAALATGRNP